MLKFKRETSGTSAIIWLITEHTATDHNRRFFLGTSMSDNRTGACSNGGPNEILMVIFVNSGYVLMYLPGCQKKLLSA